MSNLGDTVVSDIITVINKTGIHARPAAKVFQTANKFKSKLEIRKGEKSANAKSIVAILGLGCKFQDEVQIIATGDDAKAAIEALIKEFKDGLGEGNAHISPSNKVEKISSQVKSVIKDFKEEVSLDGVLASPGLVIGKSFILMDKEIEVVEEASNKDDELNLLAINIGKTKQALLEDITKAKELKQNTKVEIFSAHLEIMNDQSLVDFAKEVISKGKSAGFAWKASIRNAIEILKSTNNTLLMERTADLKDLERRVLQFILKIKVTLEDYPENTIILAKDLVPSDVTNFSSNVKGVVLSLGSSTSHVSLILRNVGTVALVAVGESILHIANNTDLILDSEEGKLIVNPDSKKLNNMRIKLEEQEKIRHKNMLAAKDSAITTDGEKVVVKGNVSNAKEAGKALDLGAEGIGLLRSEFLFFNSATEPSVEEQHNLYQHALDAMHGGSITLRTLDVGGDKPLSFVEIGHEENPIMGLRGVRNYFSNKEVFLNQLRAILRVKPLMLCKIMIPMVAEVSEIVDIKKMIQEEITKLGVKDRVEIGTMIEVPSSAILADKIAKYVDFLSIGTNDLAQYTLAMDRGNPKLTARLNNLNPALLRLIKMTVEGGKKHNKPVSVCGAMASEVRSIPILLGLGVMELSTSMRSIPDVKALIRTLDYKKCVKVADIALSMETSEEVIELVKKEFF